MLSSGRASARVVLLQAALIAGVFASSPSRAAPGSSGLWRPEWRRVAPWEYLATGAALGGGSICDLLDHRPT